MTQSEMLKFALVLEQGMEKQAAAAFAGKLLDRGAASAGVAARNATGALRWAAGGAAAGARATGRFLTKKRQLPGGQMLRSMKSNFTQGYHGAFEGEMHGPEMPPGYMHDPAGFKAGPGWTSRPSPEPSWAGNPSSFNFKSPPLTSGADAAPKLVPDPEAFQPGAPAVPKPTGYLQGAKNLWNNSGTMGRAGMAYGGVTAATAPSNYVNNRKVDWQNEHPIMSWAGRTFAGMPNYQSHNYLMPSFLQS